MAYICENCLSNNHGWCTIKKCNGLKKMNLQSCDTYQNINAEFKAEESINTQGYRVLGKREMLWHIQTQILGINQDNNLCEQDKYKELVRCIKILGEHLNFEENLWNMESIVDSMIDEDMIKSSRIMTAKL